MYLGIGLGNCAVAAAAVTLAAGSLSCGGDIGDGLRPDDPTAAGALGAEGAQCGKSPKYAEPLVVDWDSGARTDLEVAMKSGMVVVSYDCTKLRILNGCKLEGGYEFAGVSRKEQVVQMKSSDELAANLPLSVVKLSSEVKAGKSIDLAMVLVGKRSAPLFEATEEDLIGACDGATHFVRAANLGAFAMATGTVGKAAAAAEIWQAGASAKSESEKKAMTKDGDLEACKDSSPDAGDPPSECQSAIRLELMPITKTRSAKEKKDPKAEKIASAKNPCPQGYVFADGICTTDSSRPHLCAPDDEADCRSMCDKNHMDSCQNLGVLLKKKRDVNGAKAAFEKACAADVPEACDGLGWIGYGIENMSTGQKKEVLGLFSKACDLGYGLGCEHAGYVADDELGDIARAAAFYDRGCKLGDGFSCNMLADYYFKGTSPIPKNTKTGTKLLARACDANHADECYDLARYFATGKYDVPVNMIAAADMAARACKLDPYAYCIEAGKYYRKGGNPGKAAAMYNRGCNATKYDYESCRELGKAYRKGTGVPKNDAKGTELLEKACKGGEDDEEACKILGIKIKE